MMSAAAKGEIRAAALAKRDALSAQERAAFSAQICQTILKLAPTFPRGPVSIFWPIRSEIDTRPIMAGLARLGFAIALPRTEGSSLEFRLWHDGEALDAGPFGLSEPPLNAPLTRPATMLIPLAAFDASLHRIGFGKGFYDRAIAALNPTLKIGLAFSCQQVPHVPFESHDERLDAIVTEKS